MFNEDNTVEQMIIDTLKEGPGWAYRPCTQLDKQTGDVFVESMVREALVKLNPEIEVEPEKADEVIYRLRTIPMSVSSAGLVQANEMFAEWLRNEKTMPFGENNEHTEVRLINYEDIDKNEFVITNQWTYIHGNIERRFDIVLLVNGFPLVIGEAKTPVRPAITWVDGASDINDNYLVNVPAMFVPNVFNFATEGKKFHYGSLRQPLEKWGPWPVGEQSKEGSLTEVQKTVKNILRPEVLLDILQNFTVFATDMNHRRIKIICRYQQYDAGNLIVKRVVEGKTKKGLIWHFQGSGKSLLMVFAAQKLRMHSDLGNPTVIVVVDRVDLDSQISAEFNSADIPNTVNATSRVELQDMLSKDIRKIIITTIFKFGESDGLLNDNPNIIVMVDEAHRTQEGDLGRKMREALPNAFLFGLTGTPINKRDRNTFWAFGAEEDEKGYLSRYSFEESIRDKATLPLHFEAAEPKLKVNRDAIDEAFANITGDLNEQDRDDLARRAAKMAVLIKSPERVQGICEHIVKHFKEKIEPNGFKSQVVTFDRECCVLYKNALDKLIGPEASEVVMHIANDDPEEWKKYNRGKDGEEKLLDRFRDPTDPLQFLIVTAKLLTGFNAPILQVMYLDKPMRDHNLLQAICRTNRPYPNKTHGLIVDYLGIFEDVAKALDFDERSVRKVITNLDELKEQLPIRIAKCLDFFKGIDRTVTGYEGLIAAQECLPNNKIRDRFAAEFSALSRLWEALSPDSCLNDYEQDYKWLSQIYESVKPPSGKGKLLWHALGAKTIELIHKNVHLDTIRDDLDKLVMDADVLENIIRSKDPKTPREIEIKIIVRLRKHGNNPVFKKLGERLEQLRQKHEQGLITSLEFLKMLLELAKDVVEAEKHTTPEEEQNQAKNALTELFANAKTEKTPVMVERLVNDIDEIVRLVRFPGWQQTTAGEREVQKALRKTLLKFQLHRDQELFDKAYRYINQYY